MDARVKMTVTMLNTSSKKPTPRSERVALGRGALVTVLARSAKYPGFVHIRTLESQTGMVPLSYLQIVGQSALKSSSARPPLRHKLRCYSEDYVDEATTPRFGVEGASTPTFGWALTGPIPMTYSRSEPLSYATADSDSSLGAHSSERMSSAASVTSTDSVGLSDVSSVATEPYRQRPAAEPRSDLFCESITLMGLDLPHSSSSSRAHLSGASAGHRRTKGDGYSAKARITAKGGGDEESQPGSSSSVLHEIVEERVHSTDSEFSELRSAASVSDANQDFDPRSDLLLESVTLMGFAGGTSHTSASATAGFGSKAAKGMAIETDIGDLTLSRPSVDRTDSCLALPMASKPPLEPGSSSVASTSRKALFSAGSSHATVGGMDDKGVVDSTEENPEIDKAKSGGKSERANVEEADNGQNDEADDLLGGPVTLMGFSS